MESFELQKCTDIKVFSSAVMSMMKRGVVTNCFIGNAAISAAINDGTLSLCKTPDGLFVAREFPHAVRLNYYAFPLCKIPCFEAVTKPCVIEFCTKNPAQFSESELFQKQMLEQSGFEPYTVRIRLEKNSGTAFCAEKACHSALVLKLAESDTGTDTCQKAYEILCNELDSVSGCVPSYTEFCDDALSGRVYIASLDDKVAGVLRVSAGSKACEIRQLAVARSFRRMGIAKSLVSEFLSREVGVDKSCGVWTGNENAAAVALYESLGFAKSAMRSLVYLRK